VWLPPRPLFLAGPRSKGFAYRDGMDGCGPLQPPTEDLEGPEATPPRAGVDFILMLSKNRFRNTEAIRLFLTSSFDPSSARKIT